MKKVLAGIPFLLLLLTAQTCKNTAKQGVAGQVSWLEGNQMPGVYEPGSRPAAQPVKRTLHFYEATTTEQAKQNGAFFTDLTTELKATVTTTDSGTYTLALEPGLYSVFTQEDEGLWANSFDGHGRINPVEVYADSVTEHNITINYNAAY